MKARLIILSAFEVLGLFSAGSSYSQEAPKLLPFQGRLTDAQGAPVADGSKLILFEIYDVPTGGNATWPGEMHKTTVNGGLVNVLLGSKSPFGVSSPDFNKTLYLQITIDSNDDNAITSADPPLLPRQVILPAVFAKEANLSRTALNSQQLNGANWSSIMVTAAGAAADTPVGTYIRGDRLLPSSIGKEQLGVSSITLENLVAAVRESLNPPGTILPYGGNTAPPGYILCNGGTLSRTTYADLFAVIGTSFGAGDGSTTFRVPELRGLFLRGKDAGKQFDPDSGSRIALYPGGNTGDAVGSYQGDMFGSHSHSVYGGDSTSENNHINRFKGASDGTFTGATDVAGGSETRPKNVSVNYIIKY